MNLITYQRAACYVFAWQLGQNYLFPAVSWIMHGIGATDWCFIMVWCVWHLYIFVSCQHNLLIISENEKCFFNECHGWQFSLLNCNIAMGEIVLQVIVAQKYVHYSSISHNVTIGHPSMFVKSLWTMAKAGWAFRHKARLFLFYVSLGPTNIIFPVLK